MQKKFAQLLLLSGILFSSQAANAFLCFKFLKHHKNRPPHPAYMMNRGQLPQTLPYAYRYSTIPYAGYRFSQTPVSRTNYFPQPRIFSPAN